MSDFFYRRYQKKTNAQLQIILDNKDQYQDVAVNTAIQILNERNGTDIETIPLYAKKKQSQGKGFFDQIFDTTLLKKTFGFQDVHTWITLALLSTAFIEILNYYSDEPAVENNYVWIFCVFMTLILLSNHIFYKSTHKCSNNVIGRITHDTALLCMVVLFHDLYNLLVKDLNFFASSNFLGISILIISVSFIIEFVVAILRRFLFTIFKWQIL